MKQELHHIGISLLLIDYETCLTLWYRHIEYILTNLLKHKLINHFNTQVSNELTCANCAEQEDDN